jgi:ATP-dependent DNA helicase PIF1
MKSNETIDINPEFARAIDVMDNTDKSLFITGKAGTGKSTLLHYFCNNTKKKPVVLAPTGVAALNVKGQTIHSFFNFYVDVTPEKIAKKKTKPKNARLYKKLRTIIIDEVSMVRADLLDCIDIFLRLYGPESKKPFGGVQMVFVGDLYQLPPVVSGAEKDIFNGHYATPYFFSAHIMNHLKLEMIELEKVYRQKDEAFVGLLNRIRNNSVEPDDIEHLNSRFIEGKQPEEGDFYINLTTTNKKSDEINDEHLNALKGKIHTSTAVLEGKFGKEYFPTATELQFKIGAQIMLLNNDQRKRWVNGSIGVIEAIRKNEDGEEYINVRLHDSDRLVSVEKFEWEVFSFSFDGEQIVSEPVGTFTQYPFRLAWAITIHKSQGKTFDKVVIDIGRGTFVAGQMYVALSRCTSFEGIILKTPIKPQNIRTDYRIFKFLTGYQYKKAAEEFSQQDKITLLEKAIHNKEKLTMTYLKANDTKSTRVIMPLTVGEEDYRGKKFPGLRAFCTKHNEERMFHVGRILKLEKVGQGFIEACSKGKTEKVVIARRACARRGNLM